jgi:hypothetical protein
MPYSRYSEFVQLGSLCRGNTPFPTIPSKSTCLVCPTASVHPLPSPSIFVTVSPSPQSQIEEEEKLHALQKYARDFGRQHTTDARNFHWDSEDEDYGLAIGRLVVT